MASLTGAKYAEFSNSNHVFLYLTCISYGALCAQAYEYFLAFRDDSRLLKAAAAILMFLETLHIILTLLAIYHFTIIVANNPLSLLDIPWDSGAITLVDTFVVFIVQIFYLWRVWILSKKSRALAVPLGTIFGIRCGLELAVLAHLYLPATSGFVAFHSDRVTFIVYICWLSFGALGDVLMAVVISIYLVRGRTGFRSTDTVIRKVVALSVNSGAITAAVAVTALVTFVVFSSRNIVYNGLVVFASGLYANSFFGMLNARRIFRRDLDADNGQLFDSSPIVFGGPGHTHTSGFKSSVYSR